MPLTMNHHFQGEMHLTPALYAHLTNMLSVLANGKLAILMEVIVFELGQLCYKIKKYTLIGWILPPVAGRVRSAHPKSPAWRPLSATW
jgi:hypothetical protein